MLPFKPAIVSTEKPARNRLFAVELLAGQPHLHDAIDEGPVALPAPAAAKKPAPEAKRPDTRPAAAPEKVRHREATVSLDRPGDADAQYLSYLGHLRSKISSVWQYPPEASAQGLTGTVTVRFSIARSGRLTGLRVTNGSAHQLLDDEALRTIRAAAPFHAFPQEFTISRLNVLASFEYEFSGR
jgi:protein TonB